MAEKIIRFFGLDKIKWDDLISNTGMVIWVIIGLAVGFVVLFFPLMLWEWREKRGKTLPKWMVNHIGLVEIGWIALLILISKGLGLL